MNNRRKHRRQTARIEELVRRTVVVMQRFNGSISLPQSKPAEGRQQQDEREPER